MYLICDFDGTLVKNDYFLEKLAMELIKAPVRTFFKFVFKGVLNTKIELLNSFEPKSLEYVLNKNVIALIEQTKENFDQTLLISASPDNFIKNVKKKLNLFDAAYGSTSVNLKSKKKLEFIIENNFTPFVYIGDSKDDEILFKYSSYYYKMIGGIPVKVENTTIHKTTQTQALD